MGRLLLLLLLQPTAPARINKTIYLRMRFPLPSTPSQSNNSKNRRMELYSVHLLIQLPAVLLTWFLRRSTLPRRRKAFPQQQWQQQLLRGLELPRSRVRSFQLRDCWEWHRLLSQLVCLCSRSRVLVVASLMISIYKKPPRNNRNDASSNKKKNDSTEWRRKWRSSSNNFY